MTQAVLYARYSPRPGHESDSAEKQLARARSYCNANDYEIAGEFADEDLSGGRADNRPGLQEALALACRLKAVLVVYKLDRLARNTQDALAITDRLTKANADLASLTESINTRSSMGRFFLTILAAFAELERSQIRERTSAAMLHHQAGGRRMTRADRCPYGTMPDPDGPMVEAEDGSLRPARLIDCPNEQRVIDSIRERAAQGWGVKRITTWLNETGVPSRGNRWHASTVRRILERQATVSAT